MNKHITKGRGDHHVQLANLCDHTRLDNESFLDHLCVNSSVMNISLDDV